MMSLISYKAYSIYILEVLKLSLSSAVPWRCSRIATRVKTTDLLLRGGRSSRECYEEAPPHKTLMHFSCLLSLEINMDLFMDLP